MSIATVTTVLVLSDSHGRQSGVREVVRRQEAAGITPAGVIFLGDGLADMEALPSAWQLYAVRGNCDPPQADAPLSRRLAFGDVAVFAAHGHTLGVKYGLVQGISAALSEGADLFLFGHTHEPLFESLPAGRSLWGAPLEKPFAYMNPGSLYEGSFGVLTFDGHGGVVGSHGTL